MELKRLVRGEDTALVEPGSQAECDLVALGFSAEVSVVASQPEPRPDKAKKSQKAKE